MSDEILSPDDDYTPPEQTHAAANQDYEPLERAAEELTRQRDKLANYAKRLKAGKPVKDSKGQEIKPQEVLQQSRNALQRVMPATLAALSDGPAELSVRDLAGAYWDKVKVRKKTATTGFTGLNDILSGGLEAGRLVGMLGAPNCGKTTFTHQVADYVANSGRPVLYVTSEDTPDALFAKTLARIGKLNYTAVLKGYETEQEKINRALALQMDQPSVDRLRYLDATNGISLDLIKEKAQAHFARYTDESKGGGPGVLVVDYLQRIARAIKTVGGMSQDLREVVTLVTERLRAMALELNCTVIAIASQNRAGYGRGESGAMASAKESGDIEYTCDVLMALSEDKEARDKRDVPRDQVGIILHVDKNRQGQRGKSLPLNFWPARQEFTEVSK